MTSRSFLSARCRQSSVCAISLELLVTPSLLCGCFRAVCVSEFFPHVNDYILLRHTYRGTEHLNEV